MKVGECMTKFNWHESAEKKWDSSAEFWNQNSQEMWDSGVGVQLFRFLNST